MKLRVMNIRAGLNKIEMVEKNKLRLSAVIVLLFSMLSVHSLRAQTAACAQRLAQAQAMFEVGNLPGIPELLLSCIDNGLTKEENIRAHKLITEVYLYLDDQENADLWMIRLLQTDPEHKLDPSLDPQEIIFHKAKFRYKPIFRVSGSFGVNNSMYRVITRYGVGQESDEAAFTPGITINGFAQIEKEVYPGLDLGFGVGYVGRTFSGTEVIVITPSNVPPNTTTDGSDQNGEGSIMSFTESQAWLEAPVFAKYTYYGDGERAFNPYVFAGISGGYLLTATQSTERTNNSDNASSTSIPDPDLIADNRRKQLNYYAFGGLGAKIRQKTHFFFIEVRYNRGLINIVDGTGRYPMDITVTNNKQENFFNVGNVDDNFTLDGIIGVFGFQYSIYKPKKLKEKQLR